MKKEEYIKKWLNDELTEEEREEFEKSQEFNKLVRLDENLKAFKAPEYDVEKGLDQFNDLKQNDTKVISLSPFKTFAWAAAAIFLMITVSYALFFMQSNTVVQTHAGEIVQFYLPDSSFVQVNAKSRISYDAENWDSDRTLVLEGEAFFKVSKGSKFQVQSTSGTVTVLGTEFNVKQLSEFYEVACYEGLVQVETSTDRYNLSANDLFKMIYGESELKQKIDFQNTPSWIQQESTFESIPFRFVIEELQRQYDIQIEADESIMEKKFTGKFTHSDLDLALKAVTLPLNLNYRTTGNKVTLSGEEN